MRLTMEPEPEATTSFEHAVEAAAQWHRNRYRLWQEEKQHAEPGLRPALLRLALASLLQPRLAEDARVGSEDLPVDAVGRVGASVWPPPLELDGEAGLLLLEGLSLTETLAVRSVTCANIAKGLRGWFAAAIGQPARFAALESFAVDVAGNGWSLCSIGDEGAAALAKLPSLTTLNVVRNSIGAEGLAALGARAGLSVEGMDAQLQ